MGNLENNTESYHLFVLLEPLIDIIYTGILLLFIEIFIDNLLYVKLYTSCWGYNC